jgi:hypothetical protein
MSSYTGTSTGLTGIPSLLLSGLQNVQDSTVQTALYQIQQWANSVGLVNGSTGTGSAALGGNCPADFPSSPNLWTTVSVNGTRAYIPVWV